MRAPAPCPPPAPAVLPAHSHAPVARLAKLLIHAHRPHQTPSPNQCPIPTLRVAAGAPLPRSPPSRHTPAAATAAAFLSPPRQGAGGGTRRSATCALPSRELCQESHAKRTAAGKGVTFSGRCTGYPHRLPPTESAPRSSPPPSPARRRAAIQCPEIHPLVAADCPRLGHPEVVLDRGKLRKGAKSMRRGGRGSRRVVRPRSCTTTGSSADRCRTEPDGALLSSYGEKRRPVSDGERGNAAGARSVCLAALLPVSWSHELVSRYLDSRGQLHCHTLSATTRSTAHYSSQRACRRSVQREVVAQWEWGNIRSAFSVSRRPARVFHQPSVLTWPRTGERVARLAHEGKARGAEATKPTQSATVCHRQRRRCQAGMEHTPLQRASPNASSQSKQQSGGSRTAGHRGRCPCKTAGGATGRVSPPWLPARTE